MLIIEKGQVKEEMDESSKNIFENLSNNLAQDRLKWKNRINVCLTPTWLERGFVDDDNDVEDPIHRILSMGGRYCKLLSQLYMNIISMIFHLTFSISEVYIRKLENRHNPGLVFIDRMGLAWRKNKMESQKRKIVLLISNNKEIIRLR